MIHKLHLIILVYVFNFVSVQLISNDYAPNTQEYGQLMQKQNLEIIRLFAP
jgi:hypothetical protein